MKDRTYEIARIRKYDGYQRELASMVHRFFDKKTGSGVSVNEKQAEELHKQVIKKLKRRRVYARFEDNNWTAYLPEMGSFSSKNKNVKYLFCVIDVFNKNGWVKPSKKQFLMILAK